VGVRGCVFVRTQTARLNLCHFVNEFSEKNLRNNNNNKKKIH